MFKASAAVVIGTVFSAMTLHGWAAGSAVQRGASPDAATRDYVAIGCVSAGAARAPDARTFVITDVRAKDLRYRLEGDPAVLELHVGHTVELTGTIATAANASSGAGDGAALPTLKVKRLIYISTSCAR